MKVYVLFLISALALMSANAAPTDEGNMEAVQEEEGIITIPTSACPSLLDSSTSCDRGAAWMCARADFRNSLTRWLAEFRVWWESCSGFNTTKNWATFAGQLKEIRKAIGVTTNFTQIPDQLFGWKGFTDLWTILIPCPKSEEGIGCLINSSICGFDGFSCFVCYCKKGQYKNLNGMLSLWRGEVRYQRALVKTQAALRKICTPEVTGGCVVPDTTTTPTTKTTPAASPTPGTTG